MLCFLVHFGCPYLSYSYTRYQNFLHNTCQVLHKMITWLYSYTRILIDRRDRSPDANPHRHDDERRTGSPAPTRAAHPGANHPRTRTTRTTHMKHHMTKVTLTSPASSFGNLTTSEREVLEILRRRGGATWAWELFRLCGCTPSTLDSLAQKGQIAINQEAL